MELIPEGDENEAEKADNSGLISFYFHRNIFFGCMYYIFMRSFNLLAACTGLIS